MIKLAENDTPTDVVTSLRSQGLSDEQIIGQLQQQGYSAKQTSEAMNQADIKTVASPSADQQDYQNYSVASPNVMQPSAMESTPPPITAPAPEYSQTAETYTPEQMNASMAAQQYPQMDYQRGMEETIEEISESIVDERFQKLKDEMGDIPSWKIKISDDITSLKDDMSRIDSRFDNLEKAIMGKTAEYTEGLEEVNSDIKALEKVLRNIIEPLTNNIKELSKIVEQLKKKKK